MSSQFLALPQIYIGSFSDDPYHLDEAFGSKYDAQRKLRGIVPSWQISAINSNKRAKR